jgi:hypothetical protein
MNGVCSHQLSSVPRDAKIEKLNPTEDMKDRRDERPQFPAFWPMLQACGSLTYTSP